MLMSQCENISSQKKELASLLKKEFNVKLDNSIERIFILNEMKCYSCVAAFSEYVKNNVNDSISLVIIQSRGRAIDIDEFIEKSKTNPNIIVSHKINTTDKFLSELEVIYLNQHDIDTIIRISPSAISDQIHFIERKNIKDVQD